MADPFFTLVKTLNALFVLETMRENRYTITPIQALKEACDHYKQEDKQCFFILLRAVREAKFYIERRNIDFNLIKNSLNELALAQQLPKIDWTKTSGAKLRFQFSSEQHKQEPLIPWLSSLSGKPFHQMNDTERVQTLFKHQMENGFNRKLGEHIEKQEPEFLFSLMMRSYDNFHAIAVSNLSLHLTDLQVAKALVKYASHFIRSQEEETKQLELFINEINTVLSKGRSITTLLRNKEAKSVLEQLPLIKHYQERSEAQEAQDDETRDNTTSP